MMAKMRIGPKGQVVIPKHFRDDFGLKTGEQVMMDYTGKEIVIKKTASNIAEIARMIANSGKKIKVTPELLKRLDDEEYEEKYDRIRKQHLSGH
ncbi:AbrB/MazE/SpoVT family DNA-binding domain-containing protein [Candidatus Woesearchaeota archaeon]|nr:AbrB/MazE/SpoVT family DNA-binding domain-containing protein [Candidatus Woesearchaeota archaeon]